MKKKNVLPLLESLSRESIRNYRIVYRIRPREFIHAQDLFIPFRKEVNVTTVLLFPPRLMKLERKNGDAVSRRFHVGFQLDIYIYIYRKKRRTPRGRQQNRGEDRRSGGASEAKG